MRVIPTPLPHCERRRGCQPAGAAEAAGRRGRQVRHGDRGGVAGGGAVQRRAGAERAAARARAAGVPRLQAHPLPQQDHRLHTGRASPTPRLRRGPTRTDPDPLSVRCAIA
jgi:hypothetical protein